MANMISILRPDGQTLPIQYSEPGVGKTAPGIVLIQEWWGLNEHIKSVASRLAEQGYRVATPDLYRGRVTKNSEEANRWMGELNFPDAVQQDVLACVQFLKQDSAKVGVMGFCMGGAITIASAVLVSDLDAAVCFYGIPPAALADPAKIRIPIQFHFANNDGWCTPEAVNQLEKTLKDGPAAYELFRYEAEHAFFNEQRPEVYHPESSQLAWRRSLDFFKKNLA